MATQVEELRERGRMTAAAIREHVAKYGEDNIPDAEAEAHLEGLVNAQADIRDALARVERFAKASANGNSAGDAPPSHNPAKGPERRIVTLGDRFVASPEYQQALEAYAPEGRIPERGGFKMPALSFRGLGELQAALITGASDSSGGAFITTDRFAELQTLGRRQLTVLDIIRRLSTTSDLVDFVAQLSRTNAAAVVAEATAASGGSGVKPESAAAFEVRTAPVRTIANWIPVTKQAVADVPQMRGIIDTELKENLQEELEDQVISGAGGAEMTGIVNTTGTQVQAWDTNILTTTRKAKTLVRTVGRATPTAYVLNPTQWQTIDLLQDNEARYYYGGPAQVGVARLWGLPVVESEAIVNGEGLVGDFQKATLWDREAASLSVSDSHSDFFIRNLLAILAELRAAFALTQPSAMVEIDTLA